jgi:hypothetical protein
MSFCRSIVLVVIAVIILSMGSHHANGQTPSTCPTISVTGPRGLVLEGDWMDFTGSVSGSHPPNLSYQWTVWYDRRLLPRESRIVRGQGTLRLDVRAPRRVGSIAMNITAMLMVRGLPSNCPNTASETAPFVIDKSPELIDEYKGRLSPADEARHLDNCVVQLRNNSGSTLHFIE